MKVVLASIYFSVLMTVACQAAGRDVNDVSFRGDSTLMGMKIEGVYAQDGAFLVVTTGARYEYVPGELKVYQGLGSNKRLLSTITFDQKTQFEKVTDSNDHALFWSDKFNIGIYANSICVIRGTKGEIKAIYGDMQNKREHVLQPNQYLVVTLGGQITVCYSASEVEQYVANGRHIIIWWHNVPVQSLQTLEAALRSGVFTHVLMEYLNPDDASLDSLRGAKESIKICAKYNAKPIWARTLWPTYNTKKIRSNSLSDPNYYKNFILTLRKEAKILGVDLIAVDSEPYGSLPFKLATNSPLSPQEFEKMYTAVQKAVGEVGPLDFVLPSGRSGGKHYYDVARLLGKYKIAEDTYYDIVRSKNASETFDVFGAYVSLSKKNKKIPEAPYFTVLEVLSRKDLWGPKQMMMIYPKEDEVAAVANQLSALQKK
jgi:hypothetical protein